MKKIWTPKDGKIDIWENDGEKFIEVRSNMGYPAIYRYPDISIERPVKAVMMDLDGTSVKSETFWIWIIQSSIARLMGNSHFELEDADTPFVSGHSVSEHLQYCINKYCPDKTVEEARSHYYAVTDYEMDEILAGRGRVDAFTPREDLKDFLLELKARNIKIGLVTSGLYKKAMPEILSAFRTLGMGDPTDFYDSIITAGYPLGKGRIGTMGELESKPHPWLYAETMRVGLGIPYEERHHVIGIEDSSAGIVSILLAGVAPIGLKDGNIYQAGVETLCTNMVDRLETILGML